MDLRVRKQRFLLAALAGRRRPLRGLLVLALGALLVLACLGSMLQLPGPPRPAWVRSDLLIGWGFDLDMRRAIAGFWRASPGMQWLAAMYLLVDALVFVPAYALLLTGWRGRWRNGAPAWLRAATRWRRWRWALGAAALADLAENALTWAAVQGDVMLDALHVVSLAKWALIFLLAAALLALGLARLWRHRRAPWRVGALQVLAGLRDAARYVWLYAIPLGMLFGGLAMLAWVPQTREIIADLGAGDAPSSTRLQTLVMTAFMLVVWLAATGMAFTLVSRVAAPMAGAGAQDAAVLAQAHQLMVGCAALVATTTVLVRMAPTPGPTLALFIVSGSVGLWVTVARLCQKSFAVLRLPKHRRANPVAWSTVAAGLGLLALGMAASHFFPTPHEEALRAWGWYRKPDQVWRFNAQLLDRSGLLLIASAALVGVLVLGARMLMGVWARPRARALARLCMALGLGAWGTVAWQALGPVALAAQVGTIALASVVLWVLTHRTTLAEYETWTDGLLLRTEQLPWPAWAVAPVQWALRQTRITLGRELAKAAAAIVLLFLVLPYSADPALAARTGTLAVVFAALAIWGLLAAWLLVYLPMRHRLGNWTLAPFVWAALVGLLPRHAAPADPQDNPAITTSAPADAPTLHSHFAAWRERLPHRTDSPVFVVAAAGGGLRAAYWTATLLAEMDDRSCGQFGRHVLAASGVSGGSLGLALYAAQRRIWQAKPEAERCAPGRAAQMRRVLSGDFLAPVVASLLFADMPMALLPFVAQESDRGEALSRAIAWRWEREFADTPAAAKLLAQPMRAALPALPVAADQASHPVLYLNATAVETGRRVVASNVTLGTMPVDPLFYGETVSRGTRLLSARTSLLGAALHSARFPGISPPGRVLACSAQGGGDGGAACTPDAQPYGLDVWVHLLDGGYFENSGLETLGDALQALQQPGPLSIHGRLPPVFLVAISNDRNTRALCPGAPTPRFQVLGRDPASLALQQLAGQAGEARPTWRPHDASCGIGAAFQALLQVREGRARLELERAVQRFGCPFVLEWSLGELLRPGDEEPALGWMLSAASMRRMDEGVARYAASFPFDQAACPARPGPLPRARLGSAQDSERRCPPP